MALTQKLMTADELLCLPDDGQRHELVAGELRTMPPSGEEHGTVAMTLGANRGHYVRAHGFGSGAGGRDRLPLEYRSRHGARARCRLH